jgi:hypothetical protein
MKYFMLLIDGEVVGQIYSKTLYEIKDINESADRLYAILSSNPTVIATDEQIAEGSTWDGISFTPPVE